jgi:hypothetical protein
VPSVNKSAVALGVHIGKKEASHLYIVEAQDLLSLQIELSPHTQATMSRFGFGRGRETSSQSNGSNSNHNNHKKGTSNPANPPPPDSPEDPVNLANSDYSDRARRLIELAGDLRDLG